MRVYVVYHCVRPSDDCLACIDVRALHNVTLFLPGAVCLDHEPEHRCGKRALISYFACAPLHRNIHIVAVLNDSIRNVFAPPAPKGLSQSASAFNSALETSSGGILLTPISPR